MTEENMKRFILIISVLILVFLTACDYEAARSYDINLTGKQEVHTVNSSASGTAKVDLVKVKQGDYTANILKIRGTYKNLSGPATAAHWHGPALEGEDGPIVFKLKLVEGSTPGSGTFSGEKDLTDNQLHFYLAHYSYINIHTAKYKKGEIRGQIQ